MSKACSTTKNCVPHMGQLHWFCQSIALHIALILPKHCAAHCIDSAKALCNACEMKNATNDTNVIYQAIGPSCLHLRVACQVSEGYALLWTGDCKYVSLRILRWHNVTRQYLRRSCRLNCVVCMYMVRKKENTKKQHAHSFLSFQMRRFMNRKRHCSNDVVNAILDEMLQRQEKVDEAVWWKQSGGLFHVSECTHIH